MVAAVAIIMYVHTWLTLGSWQAIGKRARNNSPWNCSVAQFDFGDGRASAVAVMAVAMVAKLVEKW